MENNEAEQALQNLAEYLTKAIQPFIEAVKNMYSKIAKIIVEAFENNKIKKYIRIYNKTKADRIKKKQLKLIVRAFQVYFV